MKVANFFLKLESYYQNKNLKNCQFQIFKKKNLKVSPVQSNWMDDFSQHHKIRHPK